MALLLVSGCKHEPLDEPLDDDTGGGGGGEEVPCDPNVIWFQQQVLPILTRTCTNPGAGLNCHHTANDDNDDIQITSYETLMSSGIVQDGDLWEAINEDDEDDIMPRPPFPPLSPDEIAIIGQWLQQGAQNNSCEDAACDTLNVTYSGTIAPIINSRCITCHSSGSPSGGINLTQWSVVNGLAMDGRLEGSIRRLGDPYISMPPSGPILSDCRIRQVQLWIAQGAPNN
ncbi:MAG: hypothetical protein IPM46_12605 [Flavobacteriales bacterium]|nr:hypothetical protein [Flavobacteriales bacterium]